MVDFYTAEQIFEARAIILNNYVKKVKRDVRLRKRTGVNRCHATLQDLYDTIFTANPDELPCFVAKNLKNLPCVTPDSIDVTVLLSEIRAIRNERRNVANPTQDDESIKSLQNQVKDLTDSVRALSAKVEMSGRPTYVEALRQNDDSVHVVGSSIVNPTYTNHISERDSESNRLENETNSKPASRIHNHNVVSEGDVRPNRNLKIADKQIKKSNISTIGSRSSNLNVCKARTEKVFVSRFGPEVTAEELKQWLQSDAQMTVFECTKLSTRYTTYSSFKVIGSTNKLSITGNMLSIKDGQLWPEGVLVRTFYEKPKLNNGQSQA